MAKIEQIAAGTQPYAPPFEAWEIDTSIPDRFRRVVAQFGQRQAIISAQESLTYDELDLASDRVAGEILRAGDQKREVVALLLEQSADLIIAALGILKAGRICLALHPGTPLQRSRQLISQAGSDLLISSGAFMEDAAASLPPGGSVWDVRDLRRSGKAAKLHKIDPLQTAVLLPTSGSTGDPKLVMRSHAATLHNVWNDGHGCNITPGDRFGLAAFFGYGAGSSGSFNSLLVGSTVAILQIEERTAAEIIEQLRTFEVSVTMMSAPLLAHLVAAMQDAGDLPALRRVRSSGQTLHASLVNEFQQKLGRHCLLINGLASSETIGVCHAVVTDAQVLTDSNIPVGYPVSGKEILILDDQRALVPPGETGEIGVLSNFVSEGYWRDPELSAERFLPDPSGSEKRLYLTGDLGRLQPDGKLSHLGRLAHWTKIRGHKVQLAEIEKALMASDEIQMAVVLASADALGDDELAAYLVASDADKLSIEHLRDHLSARLPGHFVPAHFIFLERMPLLANGKIDRQALPAPPVNRTQEGGSFVAPQTLVEEMLAAIWSDVFNIEPIGRQDNFFTLGGTSLFAARIISRIRAVFGIKVEFAALFQNPVLVELATLIECHPLLQFPDEG